MGNLLFWKEFAAGLLSRQVAVCDWELGTTARFCAYAPEKNWP
jgi:hypothetical protein